MTKLNIAIFGADGAIGNALCSKYLEDPRVKKIFTFSKKKIVHNKQIINHILADYENEENIDRLSKALEENLDIILIATGSLIEPEKSLKDIDVIFSVLYPFIIEDKIIIKPLIIIKDPKIISFLISTLGKIFFV